MRPLLFITLHMLLRQKGEICQMIGMILLTTFDILMFYVITLLLM